MLLNSRRHTRCRTYDFLLKGLIYCHECGYPLAVINRKNASGEDILYFVCRTYQRFTKAGICTCHTVKESTVTEVVLGKIREVCESYLVPERFMPEAQKAAKRLERGSHRENEIQTTRCEIDSLNVKLDKMYLDRLNGLLSESDFKRIYRCFKAEHSALEEKLSALERQKENPFCIEDRAKELVQQFIDSAFNNRELLVSLIDRVELTEEKQVIIKFRFQKPNDKGNYETQHCFGAVRDKIIYNNSDHMYRGSRKRRC